MLADKSVTDAYLDGLLTWTLPDADATVGVLDCRVGYVHHAPVVVDGLWRAVRHAGSVIQKVTTGLTHNKEIMKQNQCDAGEVIVSFSFLK